MNITELRNNREFIEQMEKSDQAMVKPIAREISSYSSKVTKKRILLQEKSNMLEALKQDAKERAAYKQKMGIIHLQNFMPLLAIPILALVIYVTVGSLFMSLAGASGEKTWAGVRHAMTTDYRWVLIALSALSCFMFIINTFSFGFQKFYHEYFETITILRIIQITSSIFTNHMYVASLNESYASNDWTSSGCLIGWFTASILEILSYFGSQVFTLLVYRLYDIDTRLENKGVLFKLLYIIKFPVCKIVDSLYQKCMMWSSENEQDKNLLDTQNTRVYDDEDEGLEMDTYEEFNGEEAKPYEYLVPENMELYEKILDKCKPDEWLTKDTFKISQAEWRQVRDTWKREKKVYTKGTRTYKRAV